MEKYFTKFVIYADDFEIRCRKYDNFTAKQVAWAYINENSCKEPEIIAEFDTEGKARAFFETCEPVSYRRHINYHFIEAHIFYLVEMEFEIDDDGAIFPSQALSADEYKSAAPDYVEPEDGEENRW